MYDYSYRIPFYRAPYRIVDISHKQLIDGALLNLWEIYSVRTRPCPTNASWLGHKLNPLSPSDAYMRHRNKSPLFQIMAFRLFGATTSSYETNADLLLMLLTMSSVKCRPFCLGLNVRSISTAIYRQVSNIRRTFVSNKIVDHSDVVGASPVGAAPTTSSFST